MTIPRFEGKHNLPASYTAALFLDHLRSNGWEPGDIPDSVIITYAHFELFLATQPDSYTPNHMLGTGPGRFFLVNATDQRVAINCVGIGAPATAAQLELQAELGVQRFIVVGTAGGLDAAQSPGELIVPTSAVRDEGTSDHYAATDVPAVPDEALTARYSAHLDEHDFHATLGPTWTTSAPFRTTAAEIEHYARHGVSSVEEEVATLFVVGAALGVETAAALVIDGVPDGHGSWRLDRPAARVQLQRVLRSTVEFLATL